jgi:hypothetical protein
MVSVGNILLSESVEEMKNLILALLCLTVYMKDGSIIQFPDNSTMKIPDSSNGRIVIIYDNVYRALGIFPTENIKYMKRESQGCQL